MWAKHGVKYETNLQQLDECKINVSLKGNFVVEVRATAESAAATLLEATTT